MQEYGLKTIHVMCVYYLKNHSEGLTASELVKLTLEDKAAISRALKTLQEMGFINYGQNKYNSVIRLTDEGAQLAEKICEKAEKAVKAGSYNFSDEERLSFYNALGTIAQNLEKYYYGLIKGDV